jgi:hypothetical protein
VESTPISLGRSLVEFSIKILGDLFHTSIENVSVFNFGDKKIEILVTSCNLI